MAYLSSWHRDYAAESIKRFELNKWDEDPSWSWIQYAVECGEVTQLAGQIATESGDQFAVDVFVTVGKAISASAKNARSRRNISDKQRFILARALAERFGTARAIAAHIWNLSNEEIDNADA